MTQYIWQREDWPDFRWQSEKLLMPLSEARRVQGGLLALAESLDLKSQAEILIDEARTTAAIEGVHLAPGIIRSSVARRLGLPNAGLPSPTRAVDGLVAMLIDATARHETPLTSLRLQEWHSGLFPSGYSGLTKISIGEWRQGPEPMRVISGPIGRERIHYEAPPADRLEVEMGRFLHWWNAPPEGLDGLLRAGLAHIWFISIHPFDDGNGRVARAVTDMAIAGDEALGYRAYSMSAQIVEEREAYYDILEQTQRMQGDITDWLVWFLGCFTRAVRRSEKVARDIFKSARFWESCSNISLNERQRKVIQRLLDAGPEGFEGGITTRKYKNMTKVSRETAKRDLADLVRKGLLARKSGGGRSISYDLVLPE